MKKLWGRFRQETLFFRSFVLVQLLFLLWLGARSCTRQHIYRINAADFVQVSDYTLTTTADGQLGVVPDGTAGDTVGDSADILRLTFTVRSGMYDVTVQYSCADAPSDNFYLGKVGGTVHFDASPAPLLLQTDSSIPLYQDKTTAAGRVWISALIPSMEDFRTFVQYNGQGTLTVAFVELKENMLYRAVRFAGYLLLFLGLDALYLLIAGHALVQLAPRRRLSILAWVLLFSAGSILCFQPYLYWGHDLEFHLGRIDGLAEALREGQIPQRIVRSALNGYGYANPLFYGELFLLVPALLYNMGLPLQTAYQGYILFVNLLTCCICQYSFSRMTKNKWLTFGGTALYLLSAYRLANVYLRAAVGEYTAMAFFPLVLYGFWNIYTQENPRASLHNCLPVALGLTGVIQSHILSCEMAAFLIFFTVVLLLKKTLQPRRFFTLAASAGWTLLLNLWFLVPFLQSMQMDIVAANNDPQNIQEHGATLAQIFGIFHTADGINISNTTTAEMPLTIGFALTLGLLAYAVCYVCRQKLQCGETPAFRQCGFLVGMGLLCVLFSSVFMPWDALQVYSKTAAAVVSKIQFAWRYLAPATALLVCALVLLGAALYPSHRKQVLAVLAVLLCVNLAAEGSALTDFINTHNSYVICTKNRTDGNYVAGAEYMLKDSAAATAVQTTVAAEDTVEVRSYTDCGDCWQMDCTNNGAETAVSLPLWAYDNYHAYADADGTELAVGEDGEKRLTVTLPAGFDGVVTVRYVPPRLWHICEGISLLTALGLAAAALWRKKRPAACAG